MRFARNGCGLALLMMLQAGCASEKAKPKLARMQGESLVFIGDEPAQLAYKPVANKPITLRNAYLQGSNAVEYAEGRDYKVDFASGALIRTDASRIPNFKTNVLYGLQPFDHTRFAAYGNGPFFAFADYWFAPGTNTWPLPHDSQLAFLSNTRGKLGSGRPVRIVAFGDSITAGGEATQPQLIFWERWADSLRKKYPQAEIKAINGATGGDTSYQGVARLQEKVLSQNPDVVLIGFGMNDNNKGGTAIPQFETNLLSMVSKVRAHNGAEVILFSAFPPNPKWAYGTDRMAEYADATRRVAAQTKCAYAPVFENWEAIAARKKPEDLLGNNINHPNDFGHWIYFQALESLGL